MADDEQHEHVCTECGLPMEPSDEDLQLMEEAALTAATQFKAARMLGHLPAGASALSHMIWMAALVLTQERKKWEAGNVRRTGAN
jgi:GAF domain-containing protein